MTRQEAIDNVLEGLSSLILNHANCTAAEQYAPSRTPDESDDYIKEHKQWVAELRRLRNEFENLVTGIIP